MRRGERFLLNFACTGKGNDSSPETPEDIVKAGTAGIRLHKLSPYNSEAEAPDWSAGLEIHAC